MQPFSTLVTAVVTNLAFTGRKAKIHQSIELQHGGSGNSDDYLSVAKHQQQGSSKREENVDSSTFKLLFVVMQEVEKLSE